MKIIEISEVRTAKDGRNYFVATLRPGLGQRPVNRTFWEQFKQDALGKRTEVKYWERLSPKEAEEAILAKTEIEAVKVTNNVEAYQIGERLVNSFSTVMFPDENEVTLFNSQRHPIVNEDGEVVKPLVLVAPSKKVETKEDVKA